MDRPVVLLVPKASYRAEDFGAAAARLGLPTLLASDRCQGLDVEWPEGTLGLDFKRPAAAARALAEQVRARRPLAVVGVDDATSVIAARASALLGLPHNPPEAVEAARDKSLFRAAMARAGLPRPWHEVVERDLGPAALDALAARLSYPCVVKPLVLSGSRGVVRADDAPSLRAAFARLARLLRSPQVVVRKDPQFARVQVEEFLPGPEVALEGLLREGRLEVLAIFDKPDPLDGPFFEETLYVTPSRHPQGLQGAIAAAAGEAARALGLRDGPLHAELRLTPRGPVVIEAAARSIGGLCGRTLRFGLGVTLEELVLRHAVEAARGALPPLPPREQSAAGVLMLPIRRAGVLRAVRGLDRARAVPGVEDVVVTAHFDEEIVPLPEGASYLGFAFSRAATPAQAEAALREAWAQVEVVIGPRLGVAGA